nr:hypothetical protein [Mucilaginibacter humi]
MVKLHCFSNYRLDTPDAGTFRVGETVHLGYVDQMHDDLTNLYGKM